MTDLSKKTVLIWDAQDIARFLSKFDAGSDRCWLWDGTIYKPQDYGYFGLRCKMKSAHRLSYETFIGSIPVGMELDHLCRVRHCVNPWHLEPVTHLENVRRGKGIGAVIAHAERSKTHCPKGHEYTPENTYRHLSRGRYPSRHCKACMASRKRANARCLSI